MPNLAQIRIRVNRLLHTTLPAATLDAMHTHCRHGWSGKILHVDLATGNRHEQTPAPDFYRACPGGRSLTMHHILPHCHRQWDDPAMPVVLSTGPLTGTGVPMAHVGRMASRSPLTGTVGDDTLTGTFPAALKHAGYDAVVITGRAPEPVGLTIRDNAVSLVDAASLLTATTNELFDHLERVHGLNKPDGMEGALCIGPSATNGCLLAGVATARHHMTGRGGLGLCLAAKNLRFVAAGGDHAIAIHDPEALERANADIMRLLAASPALMGPYGIRHWGSAAFLDLTHARRMMPTDNFRTTFFSYTHKVNAPAMAAQGALRDRGCPGCPVQCVKTTAGRILPGVDALSHFTALINNADPDMALDAVALCAKLGLDPVSAAATLACNMELSGEAGYGRAELSETLRRMASGGSLGKGAALFAEQCGMPETAMTVKGLELPGYDARGAVGTGLACALSTRGGCHLRAFPVSHEVLRKPVATDRFSLAGKARIIKLAEDAIAGADSLGICSTALLAAGLEEYGRALSAVTGPVAGEPMSVADIVRAGEITCMQERVMNAENGFTEQHDDLPGRFFSAPGTPGPDRETPALDRDEFLNERSAYYAVRGLDDHGRPRPEKLRKLGLADLVFATAEPEQGDET
ncbi:aldehyde ferredoxin oxidoreductase C-terminal domain-containing protein [Pseudodesulfovibrio senegalensis]|nr:aldehyde ferredoxin oxidoreductase C-terminal domain-containing protein [Pseudodesulfovibrio senegalensis]